MIISFEPPHKNRIQRSRCQAQGIQSRIASESQAGLKAIANDATFINTCRRNCSQSFRKARIHDRQHSEFFEPHFSHHGTFFLTSSYDEIFHARKLTSREPELATEFTSGTLNDWRALDSFQEKKISVEGQEFSRNKKERLGNGILPIKNKIRTG